ncbi:MFS general substrate transporter [Trichoderma citrinoviride]|uniref:MFS general substrate transporter n=1 Tax=Trichoderma citrinoviride TaxID=58853 RepID=A0A2T4BE43_9HYPO|nr:MFS general substrate transporter [Trichoderma citrinoviride]PTB67607.1 MFS general substrate transporter [Trichoderma citrinoviride]
MTDMHRHSQTPEGLHATVASTGTTLNEDMDSKTPVPSIKDNYDGLDEKRDEPSDEKREETTVDSPVQNEELAENEYPSGIKMFFIVLALVLSVFLLSLDMIRQMDPLGVVLMMGATISYILAVQYGGVAHPWDSSVVIGLLVGFVLIIGAWAFVQWYQDEYSMVPPKLFAKRTNFVMSLIAFIQAGGFFAAIYYIPIYFQSVHGTNPTMSGVRNLPFIIAVSFSTVASGMLVSATGWYQPLLLGGTSVATIGAGLLYTLGKNTSTGKWIGYQIVAGAGWGTAFQIPMIAVQALADPKDLASATGMLLFFQGLGGAFLVSGSQSAFINTMVRNVLQHAPQVSEATLVLTGATEIRNKFPVDQQPFVIDGYMAGLRVVFAMCVACTGVATLIGLGMRWQKLNQDALKKAGGAA